MEHKIVKVHFYKAKYGNFVDKLISWWTMSPYSHTEIEIDGEFCSTSPRIKSMQCRKIDFKPERWDTISIIVDKNVISKIQEVIKQEIGKKYDWTGIFLTQIIPLNKENPNKWFCSEFVSYVLSSVFPEYKQTINKLGLSHNNIHPGLLWTIIYNMIVDNIKWRV